MKKIIIDLRKSIYHMSSNKEIIENTINIPLKEIESGIKRLNISKQTRIYVFCKCDKGSKIAIEKLRKMGYVNIVDLIDVEHAQKLIPKIIF